MVQVQVHQRLYPCDQPRLKIPLPPALTLTTGIGGLYRSSEGDGHYYIVRRTGTERIAPLLHTPQRGITVSVPDASAVNKVFALLSRAVESVVAMREFHLGTNNCVRVIYKVVEYNYSSSWRNGVGSPHIAKRPQAGAVETPLQTTTSSSLYCWEGWCVTLLTTSKKKVLQKYATVYICTTITLC